MYCLACWNYNGIQQTKSLEANVLVQSNDEILTNDEDDNYDRHFIIVLKGKGRYFREYRGWWRYSSFEFTEKLAKTFPPSRVRIEKLFVCSEENISLPER